MRQITSDLICDLWRTGPCLEPTALVWTVSSLPELRPKEAARPGVAGSPRAGEKQMEQWALARLDQTSQLLLVRICPDTVLSLVDTECYGWVRNPYDTEKGNKFSFPFQHSIWRN